MRLRAEASWPGMRAQADDPGVEGAVGPQDGFDRERGGDVRDLGEPGGPRGRQHADGGHALGAVDEGEALLGLQHEWRETAATKRRQGRHPLACEPHLPLADHRQGEVGEGGEVARGAERALFGHDGEDVPAEHLDEPQHHLASDPRVAESEHVRPQGEHGPHLLGGKLVADGDRVRAQEPVLEGRGVLGVRCTSARLPKPVVTP